jgi:DNA-binding NtrC family response regulator
MQTHAHHAVPQLLGRSAAMDSVRAWIARARQHDAPALITGETGTGKEVVAQLVAGGGRRARGPLVTVNSGALSPALVTSELFGHERGAFTGAVAARAGAFEAAHRGTLFLDEVGELPLTAQPPLLRALESGEVRRLGAAQARCFDVRIVAATHRDLEAQVAAGAFREDLFHRLHVLVVHLPPLRERRDDLQDLVPHLCASLGAPQACLQPGAWRALLEHPWPGNVRELRNVLQRALVHAESGPVGLEHLTWASPAAHPSLTPRAAPPRTLAAIERAAILTELSRQNGNRVATARALGCSRSTMYRRLSALGIRPKG